jgi:hypothetical protein
MNRYAVFEGDNNRAFFVEIIDGQANTVEDYFRNNLPAVKNWFEITSADFSSLNSIEIYPEPWLWTDITNIYNPISVQTKNLNNLLSLDLVYSNNNLGFNNTFQRYDTGLQVNTLNLFKNFHDISINKSTCFILTSALKLEDIFKEPTTLNFGQLPGTFKMRTQNTTIYYAKYSLEQDLFSQSLSGDVFHISPVKDSNEVELFVDNKYVQVDKDYPYSVRLRDYSLKDEEIHRQRFICDVNNDILTIRTLTNSGYRYLAYSSVNTLRATGLMLNESVVNNYIFNYELITLSSLPIDFNLKNHWVTYFNDYEIGTENTTVTVNKNFEDIPINYLVSFSIEEAIKTGKATVNICNLKTLLTPTGAAAPTDNLYTKVLPI